jgi:hypothetical protein
MKSPQSSEHRLHERLEQLENGVSLDVCMADLTAEEAELLRMAASLREAPLPIRDAESVATQRARFSRQVAQTKPIPAHKPSRTTGWSLPNWLRPQTAFIGAVAGLTACILVGLVAMVLLKGTPESDVAEKRPPEAVVELVTPEEPGPEPTSEGAVAVPTYQAFAPVVSAARTPDPTIATLQDPHGLVEIRAADGTWATAVSGSMIEPGQRLRTAELSSVLVAFNDSSQARLGPRTEISVEELDAPRSDGPRVVVLSQWSGQTDHKVASPAARGSRYEVRTPSATGLATGTAFQVHVVSEQLTRFNVEKGAVAVTGQQATVDVLAGQSTTVSADQEPTEPAFHISGEGQVNQTGVTWIIAGQTFETQAGTVIVGNPQVGDWVYVEGRLWADGTRIADRIVLLRRSPANRFTITGRVDSMTDTEWFVAGQRILVDEATRADDEIEKGDLVRVEGLILNDSTLLAERIRRVEEMPGLPFNFTGVIQKITDESWTVSDVIVAVDAETDIDDDLKVGEIVEVRGWILEDGTWLARVIERVDPIERAFEITGEAEGIDPWVVAGIPFETRTWTAIEPDIDVGHLVKVKGRILEDGTWVASEISRLDDDEATLRIVFVGTVDGKAPWVVNGILLQVDDDTFIDEGIAVGDLVRVTASITPDGTWLAISIERLDIDDEGLSCVYITAIVLGVGPGWIEVPGWPPVDLHGIIVEGELQVGSVILMQVCFDADGSVNIVRIIIIYQPEPVMPPGPEPPSPPLPEQDKVTICHKPNSKNPHTITISRSALKAHLGHGDTLGPCP